MLSQYSLNLNGSPAAAQHCSSGPELKIESGVICGVESGSVHIYKGIPFAESTAQENRWKPPVPIKQLPSDPFDATKFGDACPQLGPGNTHHIKVSENCLNLNIWTPSNATLDSKLPVMVFLYGGSFVAGASEVSLYDGTYLSENHDVIVVTINYRLGALGFLAYRDLRGNYGLMDQQEALRWVQANIEVFGGDRTNVLLYGESAGAMSVGLHAVSVPSSTGLFKQALMESNPLSLPYKSLRQAKAIGDYFAERLQCTDIDCLRSKSVKAIQQVQQPIEALYPVFAHRMSGVLAWSPNIDKEFVVEQPLLAAERGKIQTPITFGTNRNEGILFAAGIPTQDVISPTLYILIVAEFFGLENTVKILEEYQPVGNSFNVLARLITDYFFVCGNRHFAQQGNRKGLQDATYVYSFDQVSSLQQELFLSLGSENGSL